MFILTTISDLIQIAPEDFSKPSAQALEDNIHAKYADKCFHTVYFCSKYEESIIQKIGLCICMFDLLSASEGLIGHGTGVVNVNVTFRIVVFRPFKGEVIEGWISKLTPEGVHVSLGFFNDVLVPAVNLFEGSEFQESTTPSESVWVWSSESGEIYYDVYERCRFRVEAEIWHDSAPKGPRTTVILDETDVAQKEDEDESPFAIVGSMQQAGLGLVSWWRE